MEAARRAGPLLASMVEAPQMKASTVQSELMPWLERGDHERVPGELLDEFVAAGDPEQVQTMISRLLEAGADRVVLVPDPAGLRSTSAMVEQIRIASTLLERQSPKGGECPGVERCHPIGQ